MYFQIVSYSHSVIGSSKGKDAVGMRTLIHFAQ
jgi:hypothetical protein